MKLLQTVCFAYSCSVFIYLGNYPESGTTAPVGMSVNFRIHFLVFGFWFFFVCGICVYYIASIKPNILIILNLEIYQEKQNNEKSRNKYTRR
jgi:hypothetical protein